MTKTYIRRLLLMSIWALGCCPAFAQDGHYWTQQYGTKSMLLSGSVIGGVDDLGAVFYNPGRLAVISNAAFLLSANVYEYNAITISDAFGNSKNATKSTIKGVPTLAAGSFKLRWLPRHHFAYAVMTRQSSDMSFSFQGEQHQDVIAALPGVEYFGAGVEYIQKSNEQWIGLTWSHAITPKISVGVTTNYTSNSQSKGAKIDLQALSANNETAMYRYNRTYDYKQSGLLWKAGLAATAGPWQLGLTITTPMINLSGSGNYNYEEFYKGIPALNKADIYSTSYQTGLKVTNQTPWSVGVGASRKIGRNKIHFSSEWYSSVSKYTLMNAADHISQSNPTDTVRFHLVDQLKSVWNAGLGMEFYISEHVSGFGSFSTDFTAVTNDLYRFAQRAPEANNSGWNTDFYHVGGGIVINLKGADITLGATHTGASQAIARPVNFPDNGNQSIFNGTDNANLQWDRWRLVFSFSLPFLKNYTDKFTEEKK